jgi:hypothetical protein
LRAIAIVAGHRRISTIITTEGSILPPFSIRPGSSPDRSNSAILSRISRRDRHETGDLLDRIVQPDAIGEVQKIHLRPFFAGIHVGPVFEILVDSRFPDFFVIQLNASPILVATSADSPPMVNRPICGS